jgi:hypothetical protein
MVPLLLKHPGRHRNNFLLTIRHACLLYALP